MLPYSNLFMVSLLLFHRDSIQFNIHLGLSHVSYLLFLFDKSFISFQHLKSPFFWLFPCRMSNVLDVLYFNRINDYDLIFICEKRRVKLTTFSRFKSSLFLMIIDYRKNPTEKKGEKNIQIYMPHIHREYTKTPPFHKVSHVLWFLLNKLNSGMFAIRMIIMSF